MAKEPNEVAAKGMWQTPQQIYDAMRKQWAKYEWEPFDLEAFKKEKQLTYFNNPRVKDNITNYDRRTLVEEFDPRKKREDRQNTDKIRDRINQEERARTFPVVSSQIYGHLKTDLEGKTWKSHKRVRVMKEIYRRAYINLKPDKKLPEHN